MACLAAVCRQINAAPALLLVALLFVASLEAVTPIDYYCQANVPGNQPPPDGYQFLRHISVVTRHGDRAPVTPLPNEHQPPVTWVCGGADVLTFAPDTQALGATVYTIPPNCTFASTMWGGNCTIGQLTSLGAQQQLTLGQALRRAYSSLMPASYSPTTTFARCDMGARTRDSAIALLQGLFGTSSTPFQLVTYPIPVDTLTPNTFVCPAIDALTDQLLNTTKWTGFLELYAPLYQHLNVTAGALAPELGVFSYIDNIPARQCHSLPLPCSAKGLCLNVTTVNEIIVAATQMARYLQSANPTLLRLGAAPLVKDIMSIIDQIASGSPAPVFALYSAHDATLQMLLAAFQLWTNDLLWPPYASSLVFELWEGMSSGHRTMGIRAQYNGAVLPLPWCGGAAVCAFEKWQQFIGANLNITYPADCLVQG